MRPPHPTHPLLLVPFTAAALVGTLSLAQTPPFTGVVTKDDVPLRSGAATLFYEVAKLKAGTVLKVEKEESGFWKTDYPAGLKAFVAADEVSVDATGKTAKLIKPSRLKASNLNGGWKSSWYNLLQDAEAPAGTELKVIEAIKADDGKIAMYAVTPPPQARAFLNKEWVRAATPSESASKPPDGATPTPASDTPGGTTPPTPADTAKPAAGTPGAASPQGPATTPPAATPRAVPPAAAPSNLERLTALFNAVKAQPEAEAEAKQAIVEIEKYTATLDSSPPAVKEKKYLGRFVEYLKLRADIQDAAKKAAATNTRVDAATASIREQIKRLEAQAVYTAIGRLTASAVYDGTRLPKLYRLVSPEPGAARTLGYLTPDPAMDLDSKIGRVVGIVGDSHTDDSLKATVLTARRVEIVSLAPISPSTPSERAPEKPAPAPAPTPVPDVNK